jgi:hypothetical protein
LAEGVQKYLRGVLGSTVPDRGREPSGASGIPSRAGAEACRLAPPGERCSGSTSSARTGVVSPAAGDAAGRPGPGVPRVSAPRGAQGELCPGAGCRSGSRRSCARCGRSRWRTSSAVCRADSGRRLRALRRLWAAWIGSAVTPDAGEDSPRSGGRSAVGCGRPGGRCGRAVSGKLPRDRLRRSDDRAGAAR